MPAAQRLSVSVHGGFRLDIESDLPMRIDGDALLTFAAYLPGAALRDDGPVAGRVRHRESASPRVRVDRSPTDGPTVRIDDLWRGRPGPDLPHLLHAMALRPWRRMGLHSAHAACVATPEGAVLLAGPSGSGKSSLSLELMRAGARMLAGNKTLLRIAADGIEACAGTAAVTLPAALGPRYADLMPASRPWGGRIASPAPEVSWTDGPLPVRRILLPRIDAGPHRKTVLAPTEALHVLLPLALDAANATVALAGGAGVFSEPPDPAELAALVEALAGALRTIPALALGGPLDFIASEALI